MRCASLKRVRLYLPTKHFPALGRSNPLKILSNVLLPEPDAPTIAINSPGITSRSSPCSATTSRSATLYIFTRLSHITNGCAMTPPLIFIQAQSLTDRGPRNDPHHQRQCCHTNDNQYRHHKQQRGRYHNLHRRYRLRNEKRAAGDVALRATGASIGKHQRGQRQQRQNRP